jgi:hypothetical protein
MTDTMTDTMTILDTIRALNEYNISTLISYLEIIERDESITITDRLYDYKNPFVEIVSTIATEILTGSERFELMDILHNKGYAVRPEEQDGFGWLIGSINLPRGRIIFG